MPANFDREFSLWLTQHGQERAAPVNVLEFRHPAFASIYATDYGEPFSARKEDGTQFTATPIGFSIDIAADGTTTEQRVLIRVDNVNGAIMSQLRALTPEDLQDACEVIYRTYLDTRLNAPAIDPVRLFVTGVRGTRVACEIEASADDLPNVQAGIRYTIERFPTMAFL